MKLRGNTNESSANKTIKHPLNLNMPKKACLRKNPLVGSQESGEFELSKTIETTNRHISNLQEERKDDGDSIIRLNKDNEEKSQKSNENSKMVAESGPNQAPDAFDNANFSIDTTDKRNFNTKTQPN